MGNVGIQGLKSPAPASQGSSMEADVLTGDAFLQTLAGLSAAETGATPAMEETDPFADDSPAEEAMPQPLVPALSIPPVPPRSADLASAASREPVSWTAQSALPPVGEALESSVLAMEDGDDALAPGAGNDRGPASGAQAGTLSGAQLLAASAGAATTLTASERAAPASTPAVQQHVHAPVHSARWATEMGQRVALMALNGTQSGSLSLVPEQMGPIEVRIHMNQESASVWFGASQADTRAALQDALPRLREMFEANGLSLGEAQVSQQTPRREGEAQPVVRPGYAAEVDAPVPEGQSVQRLRLGLVDTYA